MNYRITYGISTSQMSISLLFSGMMTLCDFTSITLDIHQHLVGSPFSCSLQVLPAFVTQKKLLAAASKGCRVQNIQKGADAKFIFS